MDKAPPTAILEEVFKLPEKCNYFLVARVPDVGAFCIVPLMLTGEETYELAVQRFFDGIVVSRSAIIAKIGQGLPVTDHIDGIARTAEERERVAAGLAIVQIVQKVA